MKDFEQLKKHYTSISAKKSVLEILNEYALPNYEDLHTMICGYSAIRLDDDIELFERAESIDCEKYEKELWRLKRKL